jgi:hypothetical protein
MMPFIVALIAVTTVCVADVTTQSSFEGKMDNMTIFSKFVVSSQRLLAKARVLAFPDFAHDFRTRQQFSHLNTSIVELESTTDMVTALHHHPLYQTFDWIVLTHDPGNVDISPNETIALLRACRRLTHYGVLLHSRNIAAADSHRVFHETDFVFDDDYSRILGYSSQVYYLKQLISSPPQALLPFRLSLAMLAIEWTDVVVLGPAHFRASTPLSLQTRLAGGSIVICVNSNAAYAEKRAAIRQSWADAHQMQELGIVVFFTVAATRETIAENREFGDLLLLEASERYNETLGSVLPLKGIAGRQVGMSYATNARWFYRVDDDTLLVVRNFLALLQSEGRPQRVHILGCAIDAAPYRNSTKYSARWNMPTSVFKPHRFPRYMSGGSGYVLSRKACECASAGERRPDWRFLRIEDVLMRLTLQSSCDETLIVTSRCDRFLMTFKANPAQSIIAMHYTSPQDMFKFHANLSNAS